MTLPSSRTTTMLVGSAATVVVLAGIKAASGIVGPVMLALALTILFHPLRRRLERRVPVWLASVTLLVAAVVLLLVLGLSVGVAIAQLAQLVPTYADEFDELGASIGSALNALGVGADQVDEIAAGVDPERVAEAATSVLSDVASLTSSLFLIVTLLVFFAFDAAKTTDLVAIARMHRPHLVEALGSFARGTRSYFGVSAVFGLIVAVIDTALLFVLGVPGAFIWGVLAFVTNFIPNIGFVIGIIPPAIIALLEGGPSLMITVIVLYSAVNVVIQSFIQPRFVGDAVGLSTSLTFLSLVFWAWILGPVGALLAVPSSLLARALLVEADPEERWRLPLISGEPAEDPRPDLSGPRR
ncbi:MAG TPA: AI-2E family transporter [Nocardioides sp.]|nr:AI-2E family transporter [Nocardioides sp.]